MSGSKRVSNSGSSCCGHRGNCASRLPSLPSSVHSCFANLTRLVGGGTTAVRGAATAARLAAPPVAVVGGSGGISPRSGLRWCTSDTMKTESLSTLPVEASVGNDWCSPCDLQRAYRNRGLSRMHTGLCMWDTFDPGTHTGRCGSRLCVCHTVLARSPGPAWRSPARPSR